MELMPNLLFFILFSIGIGFFVLNIKKLIYNIKLGKDIDRYDNKSERWEHRMAPDQNIKCRTGDVKNLKVYEICKDSVKVDAKTRANCHHNNNTAFDKIYIGRTEIKINQGSKKKFLYFQIN